MLLRFVLMCALSAAACRTADLAADHALDAGAERRAGSADVRTTPWLDAKDHAEHSADADQPPTAAERLELDRERAAALDSSAAPRATQAREPVPVAAEDPDVRSLLDSYYRDYAAGDGAALAEHFWPDATLTTIRSRAFGENSSVVVMRVHDYVRQHMGAGVRATPLRIEIEPPRIDRIGAVASAVTCYHAVDPSGHEAQSWRGADLFSLVRHDGRWRIASLVFEGARFGH